MKYDLMLIGPATRDVNIDYTGKEVHEIGGAVFFCSAAAKAAGANLFASVKIHPDDTDIIDAFKLDSDHVAILPSETTTLMQNTYFTADRERRKAECLAQSGPITPDQIPEVDCGLYHLAGLLYGDFPNELIAHKWITDGADIWDETRAFNEACHPSQAKGFVWDSSNVTNEIVACTTVKNKYKKGLDCGDVDPDTVWDQMKAEYEEAGIQKILDEKQNQLNAWLEANK